MRDLGGAVIVINDDDEEQRRLIVAALQTNITNVTIVEMNDFDIADVLSKQHRQGHHVDVVITDQIGMTRKPHVPADGHHLCDAARKWGDHSIYTILLSNRTTSLVDATIPYALDRRNPNKEPKVDIDRLIELIEHGVECAHQRRAQVARR